MKLDVFCENPMKGYECVNGERVAIGLIRSSHGVKGRVKVQSLSGETEHFSCLREVLVVKKGSAKPYRIEEMSTNRRFVLMKIEGIDTPEAAREVVGGEVWVGRTSACPLDKDEYYVSDICGCQMRLGKTVLGQIRAVIPAGWADLFEIVDPGGRTLLIPFVEHFVQDVDLDNGHVQLREGFEIP